MTKDNLLKEAMQYLYAIFNDKDAELKLRLGINKLILEYEKIVKEED